jgi:hypothetical protein
MHWLLLIAWFVLVVIGTMVTVMVAMAILIVVDDTKRWFRWRKERMPYRPPSRFDKPGDKQ